MGEAAALSLSINSVIIGHWPEHMVRSDSDDDRWKGGGEIGDQQMDILVTAINSYWNKSLRNLESSLLIFSQLDEKIVIASLSNKNNAVPTD